MGQNEFLHDIVRLLEAAGIPYMLAGSIASSLHGQPRATHDVDIVVDPTDSQLEQFLTAVAQQYYVSADAARQALVRRTMFNVIDVTGGWKADLVIRKQRPFSIEEFRRRASAHLAGAPVTVVTPEDAILSKLEWSKLAQSERQYRDALGIALLHRDRLDRSYLSRWAAELDVAEPLEQLLREAGEAGTAS